MQVCVGPGQSHRTTVCLSGVSLQAAQIQFSIRRSQLSTNANDAESPTELNIAI
jgi:hypothetical protein